MLCINQYPNFNLFITLSNHICDIPTQNPGIVPFFHSIHVFYFVWEENTYEILIKLERARENLTLTNRGLVS